MECQTYLSLSSSFACENVDYGFDKTQRNGFSTVSLPYVKEVLENYRQLFQSSFRVSFTRISRKSKNDVAFFACQLTNCNCWMRTAWIYPTEKPAMPHWSQQEDISLGCKWEIKTTGSLSTSRIWFVWIVNPLVASAVPTGKLSKDTRPCSDFYSSCA